MEMSLSAYSKSGSIIGRAGSMLSRMVSIFLAIFSFSLPYANEIQQNRKKTSKILFIIMVSVNQSVFRLFLNRIIKNIKIFDSE